MKCKHCGHEMETIEWIAVPNSDYEVTVEVLHKGKTYAECEALKPKDCDFMDLELLGKIVKSEELIKTLKMDGSSRHDPDFFFKQPFNVNKDKGFVAGFGANSDRAVLDCNVIASNSYASLGVRWCRKVKK